MQNKFFRNSSLDGKSGFISFWYDNSDSILFNYLDYWSGGVPGNTWKYLNMWDIFSIWGENYDSKDYQLVGGNVLHMFIGNGT